MGEENITLWTEFVLAGLLHQKSPTIFVGVINSMFVIALVGNSLLLFLIKVDPRLHMPMYFFLSQLSVMDLCQVLAIVPLMTVNFATKRYTISLYGCALQIFVSMTVGGAECLILAIMAYDRYVAVCRPLQYPVLLRSKVCCIMSVGVWFCTSVQALTSSLYILPLPYCKTHVIIHYHCELPALIQLSCSDNSALEKARYFVNLLFFILPVSVILASYPAILLQVLRMKSTERSHKALGTCLSHLCVVGFFYGGAISTFMIPTSSYSAERASINSVFATIFPPMINPFIYSLRNRDVLAALRKVISK